MNWKTLSNRMLLTALSTFNDPDLVIIYTRGGTSKTLSKAVYDKNHISIDPNTGVPITSSNPMIGVDISELPGGESRNGDVVTLNGVAYSVKDHQSDSEGHCKVLLVKT